MVLFQVNDGGPIGSSVVVSILLWGILLGAAAWALTTLWIKHRQARRRPSIEEVRNWPVTEASIIECGVHMLGTGSPIEAEEAFYPAVRYEFVVDDEVYVEQAPVGIAGQRRVAGTRVEAERSLRGFRIGDRIQVRYDPDDPTQSRLYDLEPPESSD